jgi:hypothetical protein
MNCGQATAHHLSEMQPHAKQRQDQEHRDNGEENGEPPRHHRHAYTFATPTVGVPELISLTTVPPDVGGWISLLPATAGR